LTTLVAEDQASAAVEPLELQAEPSVALLEEVHQTPGSGQGTADVPAVTKKMDATITAD
jgi:hypothetical protein